MKFNRNQKYEQIAVYSVISIVVLILIFFAIQRFDVIQNGITGFFKMTAPFIYGFVIAYLVNPVMIFFEKRVFSFKKGKERAKKLRRPLSVVCAFLLVALIISLLFFLLIPQIVSSYEELQSQIGGYLSTALSWADSFVQSFPLFNGQYSGLYEFLDVNEITAQLQGIISDSFKYLSSAANYLINYAGRFVVEVKNIILGIILAIYFLLAKEKLAGQAKKLCACILSDRGYVNLVSLAKHTDRSFGQYLRGMLIDSLILALVLFVILRIFNFPFYPLIALIVGVTNMIPMFGPFIGAIPSAFLIFIADPMKALWFILIIIVLQQIDGNIICPRIIGNATGLSAIWVIVAITVGGSLFGIAGMVLSVPAMSVIYSLAREAAAHRLKRKNKPVETAYYTTHPTKDELPTDSVFLWADTDTKGKNDDKND